MVGRRYVLDRGVQRFGNTVLGGSPLRLFRLTDAGAAVLDEVTADAAVPESNLVTRLLDAGAIHPAPNGPHDPPAFTAADVTIVTPAFVAADDSAPVRPAGAIVVDDASPQPIDGAAVRLDRNSGPAAARNAGLRLVTTPLVAFVDTDVELPDGWLIPLLAHFDDPTVALVAPQVRTADAGSALTRYERSASPLDLGDQPARVRAGSRVSYVPAAAIVCRADAVRSIGGFDETLRFGEDVDLVWRLDQAGFRCRYEPAAHVWHAARPTWTAWLRQRAGYGSSAAPLAQRHRGALAPLRLSGWSVATWVLALWQPIAGAAVGTGSAMALIPKLPDVPARTAFELAARGNLAAGDQIAKAVRRVWWPLVALAAIRSRLARRALVASVLAARHPVRLADDLAYSVGVWRGMLTTRTLQPLIPDITSWPGKQADAPPPSATAR